MANERYFARRRFKPRVRMQRGGNEAIKQAVVRGFGVAVFSLHALAADPTGDGLSILNVLGGCSHSAAGKRCIPETGCSHWRREYFWNI